GRRFERGRDYRAVALAEIFSATRPRGDVARSGRIGFRLLHRICRRENPPSRISKRTRAADKIAGGLVLGSCRPGAPPASFPRSSEPHAILMKHSNARFSTCSIKLQAVLGGVRSATGFLTLLCTPVLLRKESPFTSSSDGR